MKARHSKHSMRPKISIRSINSSSSIRCGQFGPRARQSLDAYTQSIIMPVVGLAESEVESHPGIRPFDVSWIYYRGALDQSLRP
jgi:hypothetical protein